MLILLMKSHVAGYTRADGIHVRPHEDRRVKRDAFEDDMHAQMDWLSDRAQEQGFSDIDDMLSRDPSLFARLAAGWRESNPRMAKAIHAIFAGNPTPAQAASGNYRKPTFKWHGLTIAIENPAGSVRRGRNRDGGEWEVRMVFDYGEIKRTEGVDGDPVDVIVGQNLGAPMVYVVHQRKYGAWDEYDEDKCCIGFDTEDSAKAAFLANYNDPRFLGPITAMPVAEFVAKVRATRERPAMIKALFLRESPQS